MTPPLVVYLPSDSQTLPIALTPSEQEVLDESIRAINEGTAQLSEMSQALHRHRDEVTRLMQVSRDTFRAVLIERGFDPGDFQADVTDGHVAIRPKAPPQQ